MRRLLRFAVYAILVLLVVVSAIGIWKRDDLVRLWNVNTLFDDDKITANFVNMPKLFFSTEVKRSGPIAPLFDDKLPLPENYAFNGENRGLDTFLEQTKTTSLLVLREGRIIHEAYFQDTRPEDRRISWSVAKSFLSAIFGIAVGKGNIKSLDETVDTYVPSLKGTAYEGVTIRNVLMMSSGVKFDEDYQAFGSDINRMGRVLALGGSMDEFARSLKERVRGQGTLRQYTSIDTHILAMVLRAATNKDMPDLMREMLWSQLGAEDDAVYLTDGYGVAFALGGLNMRTRDYARFGQMMMDFGRYNQRQIVPADWVVESTKPQAPASANVHDKFGYGYQWWVPVNADDEFYAIGVYGQYTYVNRPARVVVVKTSAHPDFDNDGAGGALFEAETIEAFRAIASSVSVWKPKAATQ